MSARTEDVHFRCTPQQRANWEQAASLDQRTLTDWIRIHLDKIADVALKKAAKQRPGS
jgi:uncharacterized protein (DUF1778 family)